MNFPSVCAVVVTYADRADLARQTVNRALENGVGKVVLVDNGSKAESKAVLEQFASRDKRIQLVSSKENLGSSVGFKVGLREAYASPGIGFILCLDDDNLLCSDKIVERLMKFWEKQKVSRECLLFCLRYYDWDIGWKSKEDLSLDALEKSILNLNSYCYFNVNKLYNMIKRRFSNKARNTEMVIEMPCGAWGGMFFHKSVIDGVGYPDESFFCYFEDTAWTYSAFKKGFKLFLLRDCRISDLDTTLVNKGVKSYFQVKEILENIRTMNPVKRYYGYRNRIKIERSLLITNRFRYNLNKFIYKFIIRSSIGILYFLKYGETKALKEIDKAVRDGERL